MPIILDGENAWEHYPHNGSEFLKHLYETLGKSSDLRTVTFSEYLDLESRREPLSSIVSGSWIYGNLATWIGHPEKNRAWELMSSARRLLGSCQLEKPDAPELPSAFHEMMIAEGSDWFWWFGDDHQTENAAEFDALFRSHLKNVYALLAKPLPPVWMSRSRKHNRLQTKESDPDDHSAAGRNGYRLFRMDFGRVCCSRAAENRCTARIGCWKRYFSGLISTIFICGSIWP